jgi:hypothetical protein
MEKSIGVMWSWPKSGKKGFEDYDELDEMIKFQVKEKLVMLPSTMSLTEEWEARLSIPFPLYLFDSVIQKICCSGIVRDYYPKKDAIIPQAIQNNINRYSAYPYNGMIFNGTRQIRTYFFITQLQRIDLKKEDFLDIRKSPPQILQRLNPSAFSYVIERDTQTSCYTYK